jgi:threonine dehydrogenase-like Zn-dependent dehydrogenase
MRALYVDKDIPRVLLAKTVAPWWPGFVWTALSPARMATLPDPPLPGPRWMRLKNQACGICASDLSLLFVKADPSIAPAARPGLSRFWLGHELAAVVTETGPGVTRFKVGDRVTMDTYSSGATCESLGIEPECAYCREGARHLCLNGSEPGPRGAGAGFGDTMVVHESEVYPVPQELSRDQVVLIEPYSVALYAVMRHPPPAGGKVLVIGAGIIGLLMVAAVHALVPDAQISVLARYPHQQAMADRLGAQHILAHSSYPEMARLTGGKFFSAPLNRGLVVGGFDLVYDCVASPRTLNDALRWVRAEGTVMMVGVHLAPMPQVDLTPVLLHQVNLVGTYSHGENEWDGMRRHTYDFAIQHLRAGSLDTTGLITHRYPLDAYKQAIRVAKSKGKEHAIKVLFEYE